MIIEKYFKLETSVYDSLKHKSNFYICGSDWNRRKIKYSKEIAKKSRGKLSIYNLNNFSLKEIFLPSMCYTICKCKNNFFVGCKSEIQSFNLFSFSGKLLKTKDDLKGSGCYESFYNKEKNEIVITTRNGFLKKLNADNLNLKKEILLTKNHRLWALKHDLKLNLIYCGDYFGNLYVVEYNNFEIIKKINLREYFKKETKTFGPSIWGLEIKNNDLIIATRWNKILIVSKNNFDLKKEINISEDLCAIKLYDKKNLIIGSRFGKLFNYNFKNKKLTKIKEIKPALQKENAIWTIKKIKNNFFINFADGLVLKIK